MATLQSRDADAVLRAAFERAAPEHYAWQTEAAFVADRERELVCAAFLPLGERVLDVGCGEGATLFHLGAPPFAVGLDLFEDKLAFARQRNARSTFVTGSAYELPFEAGRFDHVLVRDLIHHLEEPARFVDECARVLTPEGRIDVLEPSRYNPLVFAHALARREERGELRSTMRSLSSLLRARFRIVARARYQPMPLHRVLFNPELGSPRLAQRPGPRKVVEAMERWAARIVPKPMWAYAHVRAVRDRVI